MARDPAQSPSRLRQASYILKCISDARKEIVEKFDGEEQLVLTWTSYLMEDNLNIFQHQMKAHS